MKRDIFLYQKEKELNPTISFIDYTLSKCAPRSKDR